MSRFTLAAMLLLAGSMGGVQTLPRSRSRKPPADPGPRSVACPRCGAEPGDPCDRRTLGRHRYHRARVDAAK